MLLRRITKHVTEQNWFAVFIDFLIVVIGVFIGIQVANWNEGLKAKHAERNYIERMHDDIEFAQEFVKVNLTRRMNSFEKNIEMVQLMNGDGSELKNDYVDCYFPGPHSISMDLPYLNTINELLDTGEVNVLTDDILRKTVLELQNRTELLWRFQDQIKGSMVSNSNEFADAIRLRSRVDELDGEIRLNSQCNLKVLHASNRFLNAISESADITDAFITKRLIPWSEQIDVLHELIDHSLQLSHENK